MRYLVRARLKPGMGPALLSALADGSLGRGSVAGDEYESDLKQARLSADGTARWVEVCFCRTPLEEERPYWEKFFELISVKDAHSRRNCRHENGSEPWACCGCDCTAELERKLRSADQPFLEMVRAAFSAPQSSSTKRTARDLPAPTAPRTASPLD
jgi:hypothetical protein